jgi:hypothetical protein
VLTDTPDRLVWRWTTDGSFSVQLAYQGFTWALTRYLDASEFGKLGHRSGSSCFCGWRCAGAIGLRTEGGDMDWIHMTTASYTTKNQRQLTISWSNAHTSDRFGSGQRWRWVSKRTSRRPGPSWNGGTLGVRSGQGAAEKAPTHSLR